MFNTSTRKEDVSVKLKAQNLKNTRAMTEKLEVESRRMEDRLEELKMAMTREKEERDAKGGGFWRSGKEGNLGNYATDVLNKPSKKSASSNRERSSKSTRVKVLKDEPIVVPERKKGPGTMKNIAQQNPSLNKDKIKGPKCGQCEAKKAHVSCQECGEDYCAGCFAAFHLKGALKKHRSTPIGSGGMRPALSPRPNATPRSEAQMRMDSLRVEEQRHQPQLDYNDNRYQNGAIIEHNNNYPASNDGYSEDGGGEGYDGYSEGGGGGGGGALLNGTYDEGANEAEFQAALRAWRGERTESGANDSRQNRVKEKKFVARKVSPRKTEGTSTGTGTLDEKRKPVEIKFSSKTSLTYAERLLLKRHRRKELGMLPPNTEHNTNSQQSGIDDNYLDEEEHVDFDEVIGLVTPRYGETSSMDPFLRSAHVTEKTPTMYHVADEGLAEDMRSESRVSIIEVDNNVPARRLRHFEQTSSCDVVEGPEVPSMYPNDKTSYWSPMDRTPTPPKEGKHRYAFATPPSSGRPSPAGRPRSGASRRSYVISPISAALKQNKENLSALEDPTGGSIEGLKTVMSHNVLLNKGSPGADKSKQTPPTSARKTPRPKSSARQRPASRTTPRAKSRAGSGRPGSRAHSRISMFGEGVLTKGPSESLKEVARLVGQLPNPPEYKNTGLTDFFTVGVKPMEPRERTITPSGQRNKEEEGIPKWRVSNKLYSMSAKSWRPGSSLGDTVEDGIVTSHMQDTSVRQLEEKLAEVEVAPLTPREQLELASIAPSVGGQAGSVVSWQYSDHKSGKGARVATQERYELQLLQDRARERSEMTRERTNIKRQEAANQKDDIFPVDVGLLASSDFLSGQRSSRVGTPRTASRPSSRGVKRPDSGRPSSRSTPRLDSSRLAFRTNPSTLPQSARMTPDGRAATPSRPMSSSGRESRAILPDGDDMTQFDDVEEKELMNADDTEAIEQLEWELASQEGRITADGKLSRMSLIDGELDEGELGIVDDDGPGSGLSSPDRDQGLLDKQLRESVLMDDFDEMEDRYLADEVKALK